MHAHCSALKGLTTVYHIMKIQYTTTPKNVHTEQPRQCFFPLSLAVAFLTSDSICKMLKCLL